MGKENKIIIAVSLFVILIATLFFIADPQGAENYSFEAGEPSLLTADTLEYNFGDISMKDGDVYYTYTITNPTDTAIALDKIYTSCMCTEATLIMDDVKRGPFGMPGHGRLPAVDVLLMPGDQADIEVVFDPAAHGPAGIGPTVRAVMVEAKNSPSLQLLFKANVTP